MTFAALLQLLINLSMGIVVLSLALGTSFRDATYLLRHKDLLWRSVLSMSVIMPVVAVILVMLFDFHPAVKIGIVLLALSPVPPVLPMQQRRAGGSDEHIFSLLLVAALLSLVIIPVGLFVLGAWFGLPHLKPGPATVLVLLITIVVPLVLGMAVHQLAPEFSKRAAKPLALLGYALLILSLVPVLFMEWGTIVSMIGNGTLLALAIFTVAGVAVGHWLGGPDRSYRAVLALATGARHPGIALAVATAAFPDQTAIIAVVLWHLVVSAVLAIPYIKWVHRDAGLTSTS